MGTSRLVTFPNRKCPPTRINLTSTRHRKPAWSLYFTDTVVPMFAKRDAGDPNRPARDDRDAVTARILDQLPDRVAAALGGSREALLGLLLIAADVSWQSRSEILGTVEEVAGDAHRYAEAVADCYSADRPPSDQLCDWGLALADRVDALAVEVLIRREHAGLSGSETPPQQPGPPARALRHVARAHVAALRDAVATHQPVPTSTSPPLKISSTASWRWAEPPRNGQRLRRSATDGPRLPDLKTRPGRRHPNRSAAESATGVTRPHHPSPQTGGAPRGRAPASATPDTG
jgi:hypothetical protein